MNILEELSPLKNAVCHWNCADLQGTLFVITLSHIYVYIVLSNHKSWLLVLLLTSHKMWQSIVLINLTFKN
jgi:hypothetical protein